MAAFLPEQVGMLKEMQKDYFKEPMPILDEYQIAEFERKIHYAMEYKLPVVFSIWNEGFTRETAGHIHYIHPITKEIHLKKKDDLVEGIQFENIVGVKLEEAEPKK